MPHQLQVGAGTRCVRRPPCWLPPGEQRSDPTGMIACPEPCNVRYAAAYSFYSRDLTRYAASWENEGESFSFVLEYEFENQIWRR